MFKKVEVHIEKMYNIVCADIDVGSSELFLG